MRRFLAIAAVAATVAIAPTARAHDAYDDTEANPLRIAAYAIYPIGYMLEWMVTRPIHFLVSQPKMEPVFGHVPHENPFGPYSPYDDAQTD